NAALWSGDVLSNSYLVINFELGRWEGSVFDNPGNIGNYGVWSGDLTNRGGIINTGIWTGDIVNTGALFRAQNQIVGNFDNRGQVQLTGDLSISGMLTNSGRLQLTHNSSLQTLSLGSAVFAPSSSYEIDVTAAGASDKIVVAGHAALGGGISIVTSTVGGGTCDEEKSYTILSAGSISGTFAGVTTDLAFIAPRLTYDANNVYLGLRRNDVGFAATGATGNQVGVGSSVEALGAGNPIYDAVLWLT